MSKKEFNFEGAKRGARLLPKETKVAVTMRFDGEIFLWLQAKAKRTGMPYQALVNDILREALNASESKASKEKVPR